MSKGKHLPKGGKGVPIVPMMMALVPVIILIPPEKPNSYSSSSSMITHSPTKRSKKLS
jgi:hypothetical protein